MGNLRDVYHFMMEDPAQRGVSKRSNTIYKLRVMNSQPDIAAKLQTEEQVRDLTYIIVHIINESTEVQNPHRYIHIVRYICISR